MNKETEDFIIEHQITRRFKFGSYEFSFMDNGNVRKAWIRKLGADLNDSVIAKWEGSEEHGRWIASAVVYFAKELKDKSFPRVDEYCLFCCIGLSLTFAYSGQHWHEAKFPNEIDHALAICSRRTKRVFTRRGLGAVVTTKTKKAAREARV